MWFSLGSSGTFLKRVKGSTRSLKGGACKYRQIQTWKAGGAYFSDAARR